MKFYLVVCFLLSLILITRFIFFLSSEEIYIKGQEIIIEHTLLDEPKSYKDLQYFYINNLQVRIKSERQFHYGDTIELKGIIEEREYFSKQKKQMIKTLVLEEPKVKLIEDHRSILLAVPAFIRERVIYNFNSILAKDEAGLLMGIVFGIKGGISQDFYDALKNTGVLHVVAASGMNVSMVGGFLQSIFALFVRRQLSLILAVLGVFCYALLTGFEASIIRASIMLSFAYLGGITGRQNFSYLSLFFACFLMLMESPNLLKDVGFQLSFFATFGIISFKPLLDNVSKKYFMKKFGIIDDLTTTFAAQITTLPILFLSFGSYSILSIIINTFVLWTIPIIMVFGGFAAIIACVIPFLSIIPLYLSYPFLLFFKQFILLSSSFLKPSSITDFSILIVIGYYLILIAIILYFHKKRS